MKCVINELLYLVGQALLGAAFFVLLFWVGALSGSVSVLMYRGIALALIAALLQLIITGLFLKSVREAGRQEPEVSRPLAGAALAFAINMTFLVVVPVTIDRSVSVYLLGQLARHPNGLTEQEMQDNLIRQYVIEYGAVQRRMQEQALSGNVRVSDGRYSLSEQGDGFVEFSTKVAGIFGADPKYISGGN